MNAKKYSFFTHVRLFTIPVLFLLQAKIYYVSFVVHWPCDDDFYGKTIRILFVASREKKTAIVM